MGAIEASVNLIIFNSTVKKLVKHSLKDTRVCDASLLNSVTVTEISLTVIIVELIQVNAFAVCTTAFQQRSQGH